MTMNLMYDATTVRLLDDDHRRRLRASWGRARAVRTRAARTSARTPGAAVSGARDDRVGN